MFDVSTVNNKLADYNFTNALDGMALLSSVMTVQSAHQMYALEDIACRQ